MQLRENREAFFSLPEAVFDITYPGHYFRRIKAVILTMPCVAGPYTNINATLTLLKSSVRLSPLLANGKYARSGINDIRFRDVYGESQSIVTSSGQNDSGLFEANLRDERLLSFERAGAVSNWRVQLPNSIRQFDYRAITDVIIHVRYTAREAGDELRNVVQTELKGSLLSAIAMAEAQQGFARLVSLRPQPNGLYPLFGKTDAAGKTQTNIDLGSDRFPFVFRDASITIEKLAMFVFIKKAFKNTHNQTTMKFWVTETQPPETPGDGEVGGPEEPTEPGDPDGPALVLAEHMHGYRAGKPFKRPAGNYLLKARLSNGGKIQAEAIEDVFFVCYYSVKWEDGSGGGGAAS